MLQIKESFKVSKRIAQLKENVLSAKSGVCTERANFYTQIYREHEDKPVIIRRALALEKNAQGNEHFHQ
jgi:pyruvate-formate lyase